jgi:hypothetical protein
MSYSAVPKKQFNFIQREFRLQYIKKELSSSGVRPKRTKNG